MGARAEERVVIIIIIVVITDDERPSGDGIWSLVGGKYPILFITAFIGSLQPQ